MTLKTDIIGIISSTTVAAITWSLGHVSEILALLSQGITVVASLLSVILTIQLVHKNILDIKERKKKLKDDE